MKIIGNIYCVAFGLFSASMAVCSVYGFCAGRYDLPLAAKMLAIGVAATVAIACMARTINAK